MKESVSASNALYGFINPNPNCWGLDIISEDLQSLVNICEAGCWSPMTERERERVVHHSESTRIIVEY